MKKILLIAAMCIAMAAGAQSFDETFVDGTLRLDYVLAGNSHEQRIYFSGAKQTSQWAGRRTRLTDIPLRGNGQITLSDHESGHLLYVHTFSTLFQEWLATEEATRVDRAFQTSFNVPMPKRKVDVKVTLTAPTPKTDIQGRRNFMPTEGSLDGEPDITACIDLAIVAEGYTHEQMGKFYADCQRAIASTKSRVILQRKD